MHLFEEVFTGILMEYLWLFIVHHLLSPTTYWIWILQGIFFFIWHDSFAEAFYDNFMIWDMNFYVNFLHIIPELYISIHLYVIFFSFKLLRIFRLLKSFCQVGEGWIALTTLAMYCKPYEPDQKQNMHCLIYCMTAGEK